MEKSDKLHNARKFVLFSESNDEYETNKKMSNMYLNRFTFDEDEHFEVLSYGIRREQKTWASMSRKLDDGMESTSEVSQWIRQSSVLPKPCSEIASDLIRIILNDSQMLFNLMLRQNQ